MKLSAEDKLLGELLRLVPVTGKQPLGPGDDCAALAPVRKGQVLLLKTDCVAEDVHFLRSDDPGAVAWKALCRPLSDIAAMGGTPGEALITFFSPPNLDPGYWKKFYHGLGRAARRFGITIAGGEMSRQKSGIAVSVVLTGTVARKNLLTRAGGREGDLVFVTGKLGGSINGHHLRFVPRLKEGRWLAENIRPTAMMDISDGLGADLPRLARASGCGFDVDFAKIPCGSGSSVESALSDGEDYELLFTLSPRKARVLAKTWPSVFPKTSLTCIGLLTSPDQVPANWPGGWDHFSTAKR